MPHFDVDWKVEMMQLERRLRDVYRRVFALQQPMEPLYTCVTGGGKGPESIPKTGWRPFSVMERWGGYDQTTWFRMQVTLPKAFAGKRAVALLNPCAHSHVAGVGPHEESGEGLVYINGTPRQGIDRNHGFVVLAEKAKPGERHDIALECCPSTRFDSSHVFAQADMAIMHTPLWDFYWDGMAYLDLVRFLPEEDTARRRLFTLLFEAARMVAVDDDDDAALVASATKARTFLRRGLKDFPALPHSGTLGLIGHSHIDTAWLWPLRETKRKVGRTFATVLRLMEQYPEFYFSASQPELYMFVKEHYPALWKEIKRRARQGRWEPCGATWVEQDSNVPCGESLVRQLLYGNRFFEQEFGKRSTVAWLPDAFGFPWSLPQLFVRAGIETFHTIKISWSRYTRFPFGYFWWQGADGTRIRAVMPPVNYNGDPTPEQCARQWEEFQQKHLVDEVPFSFGFGDGGGGPTPKMIEYGRRYKTITGLPQCHFTRTEECFERMHAGTAPDALPVHNGELYLELHRACQTTQARTKRNNRKCEWLLHTAEWLCATAALYGKPYDRKTINAAWRILLTHQFHDILPGSSITEVYADADRNYAAIKDLLTPLVTDAQTFLATQIATDGEGTPIIVWNPLSWERDDVVLLQPPPSCDAFHVVAPDGTVMPSQRIETGAIIFEARRVPPLGHAVYRLMPGAAEAASGPLKATPRTLENRFVKVRLDNCGRFTRVFDKQAGREVLADGQRGNVLQLFEDRPAAHDAWDFDFNFEEVMDEPGKADTLEVVESGPVRAVVRVVRRTERSVFTQDITLYAARPRIDVNTHVDWQEKQRLLKVAFPVDVLTPKATYHIQFAAVERTTHKNTAFDHARFEVTGHHWADLSEAGYGVSLLNDCKYGYDVRDNVLRLSLLRAPLEPDPHADEGEHRFTYALLPHAGDWRTASVREGYELNAPLLGHTTHATPGPLPDVAPLAETDQPNVIVETVKQAEDSDALVVRLYEAHGARGMVSVRFGVPVAAVTECNLMEDPEEALTVTPDNVITFYIKPFQVRSFLVTPARQ